MFRSKRQKRRLIFILLGVMTLVLIRLANRHRSLVETVYGEFCYPAIRGFFSITLGWLPFPAIYLVLLGLVILLFRTVAIPIWRGDWSWKSTLTGILSTFGAIIFFFYFLWGFNYSRAGVAQRMDLPLVQLDSADLEREFAIATAELVYWTNKHAPAIREDFENATVPPKLDRQLAMLQRDMLRSMGYANISRPRGRRLFPKGSLMYFGTAGIYIPFSGEGHVDAGMLNIQLPFTMAHELAHGYGVTDEGECNFIGYLTCIQSEYPLIRFSGLFGYWRYIAYDYRRNFPEAYALAYEKLPPLIRECQKAISENNAKYPDIMPKVRHAVYDTYLKSNGIREGYRSYSLIVRLVHVWRQRQI